MVRMSASLSLVLHLSISFQFICKILYQNFLQESNVASQKKEDCYKSRPLLYNNPTCPGILVENNPDNNILILYIIWNNSIPL